MENIITFKVQINDETAYMENVHDDQQTLNTNQSID